MTVAAFWWVNTVNVETFQGATTTGQRWAASQPVDCWVEAGTQMVRNSDGQEVVSSAAIHGPLDKADMFVAGSRVTIAGQKPAQVLTLDRFDSGSLGLGLEHFVAHLK